MRVNRIKLYTKNLNENKVIQSGYLKINYNKQSTD